MTLSIQAVPPSLPPRPVQVASAPVRPSVTAPRVADWPEAPLDALRGKGEAAFHGPNGSPRLVKLAPFNPNGEVVVFIHGIMGDPANQEALIKQAQSEGKQVYVMAYDTLRYGASRNAEGFARELQQLGTSGARDITIVAHSLGGMTSKGALDRLTDANGHIAAFDHIRFVALGVPWGGVSASNAAMYVLTGRPELAFARDLGPDSPYWKGVAATPFSKQVTFDNVVGTDDQFQVFGWGSKTRDTNQEAILKQASHTLVLPGEAHNTVLWHPDTLKFFDDPAGVSAPTTKRWSAWKLFLKEMAANMNLPGAFQGG
jgi:pimeloyl-ACP methyl ester carboxylesterase